MKTTTSTVGCRQRIRQLAQIAAEQTARLRQFEQQKQNLKRSIRSQEKLSDADDEWLQTFLSDDDDVSDSSSVSTAVAAPTQTQHLSSLYQCLQSNPLFN